MWRDRGEEDWENTMDMDEIMQTEERPDTVLLEVEDETSIN